MLLVYEDTLQHHGVKGMRWGHRKQRSKSNKQTKKKQRKSFGQHVDERFKGWSGKEILRTAIVSNIAQEAASIGLWELAGRNAINNGKKYVTGLLAAGAAATALSMVPTMLYGTVGSIRAFRREGAEKNKSK